MLNMSIPMGPILSASMSTAPDTAAFVISLEELNAYGHSMGRPDDAGCMIIEVDTEQLHSLLAGLMEFQDFTQRINEEKQLGQAETLVVNKPVLSVHLCDLPDDFTEMRRLEDNNREPTRFEQALYRAETTGRGQLYDGPKAAQLVRKYGQWTDYPWTLKLASQHHTSLSPIRLVEREEDFRAGDFHYDHLLAAALVCGAPDERRMAQQEIRNGFPGALQVLQEATDPLPVDRAVLQPLLQKGDTRIRKQVLQLLGRAQGELRLEQELMVELLQSPDKKVRQLAGRLSHELEEAPTPQTRSGRSR